MGPQGARGPAGPQGPQGERGFTGATGPQGPQGETGPQGERGFTGATGPQGPQGETGPQGPQGETGPQGERGFTGATGPQGPKGETGATGPQGPQGETGPQGERGFTGATGPQGPQGETGPQGPQGETGPQGERGFTGATGPQGPKGETGATGPQGPQGETGPQGPQGETGPQGEAATITVGAVTTGEPGTNVVITNSGTSQDAVLNFTIPRGAAGGTVQSLAIVDTDPKIISGVGEIKFTASPYVNSQSFDYTPGTTEISIVNNGVYQAFFHCTVVASSGSTIPTSITIELRSDGTLIPGSPSRHIFRSTGESASVTLSTSILVTDAPIRLTVYLEGDEVVITDCSLTIIRLQ